MKFSFAARAEKSVEEGSQLQLKKTGIAHRATATTSVAPPAAHVQADQIAGATVMASNVVVDALSQPDAEFELCGWLLRMTPEQVDQAHHLLDAVKDSDFAHPHYRNIIVCARELVGAGQVAGATAVTDYAAMHGLDVGGVEHLAALIADPINAHTDGARLDQAVDIIIDYAKRRKARQMLMDRLEDLSSKPVSDVANAMSDDAVALMSATDVTRNEPKHISDYMSEVLDEATGEQEEISAIPLGLDELDEKLNGGVRDEDLIIVAGRPAMGKTAFTGGIARNMSLDSSHKRPVLFFSLEMTGKAQASRLLSAESAVPAKVFRQAGALIEHDAYMNAVTSVLPRFASLEGNESDIQSRLWIDDTPGLSMPEIRSRSRVFARKFSKLGRPIIIVDYLQIIGQTERISGNGRQAEENQTQAIGKISQGLKALARELRCPVIALSQLNRTLEQRANKRPIMSDLRESGNVEQDADIIIFLYRDVVYNPETADPNEAEAIIGKQREGEIGPVFLTFNNQVVRFENRLRSGMSAASNQDY